MSELNNMLEIDLSDVQDLVDALKFNLSVEEMEKRLVWIVDKTGRRVKPILQDDLPINYVVDGQAIGKAVKRKYLTRQSGGAQCVIPLGGERFSIGGNHITDVTGGVSGWESLRYTGRPYTITATILKGKTGVLPKMMKNQGGNPPFRNTHPNAVKKLHNVVYVRKGKGQTPIASVSALAVPQMPMNQSAAIVGGDILKELEAQFMVEISKALSRSR